MENLTVDLRILGGFEVLVNGVPLTARWETRRACQLVQLLALAPGHRLMRDQIMEAFWPDLEPSAGMANLRKAAFHARRTLGDDGAVVLRQQQVLLYPDADLRCDLTAFLAAAADALQRRDPVAAQTTVELYAGPVLPAARYEDWADEPRRLAAKRHVDLLRLCGRLDLVLEHEPTDTEACRAIMTESLRKGQRHRAIAAYELHRQALLDDVGVAPDAAIEALYRRARSGLVPARPTLIGRAVELASIDALLAHDAALPRLVVIRGPSGIGKTEVARELCRRATAAGWVTGCVTADDPNDGYATVGALIERLVERRRHVVNHLDSGVRARLAFFAPNLGSGTPSMPMTRHQVIGVTQRLLYALASDTGRLVVVDDLECADPSSLEVLGLLTDGFLGRLIVCLVHREPASDRVESALARAGRLQPMVTFELGPLGPQDARALARQVNPALDAERLDELVASAEGIPLFLTELAAARSSGVVEGLPGALLERLVDLTGIQVACLRRLSLVTEPLNLADVLALCDLDEDAAETFLDSALASGILVVADSGYRFRHGLVRSLLADQLPPHRRASAHRVAARRLVKLGGLPGRIAEHWAQGRRPAAVADWFTLAARDALTAGAHAAALTFVDAALAQVPRHPTALHQRATVLDALGDIRALSAFDAAIEVADNTEIDDLRSLQALAQIKLGDPAGALRTASDVKPRTLPAQLARALTFSGAALLGAAGPEVGSRLSAEGRHLALRVGDPAAVTVASWSQAAAAHARGALRSSLFADLEDTQSLPGLAVNVFDGQLCITQRLLYGDRPYDDVIRFTDRFRAEAARMGAARALAFATTLRGEAELLSGRLDAAEQDLREGAERHHRLAAATGESFSYQRLAEVAHARGERRSALRLLDKALAIARDSGVGFHLFDRIYGTRITLAQDPQEGHDLLQEAEEAVRGPFETCPGCRVTLAVPAAIAAARAGDQDRLAAWEEAAAYLVSVVMHLPAWDAALEEVHGFSALAREKVPEAASHFVDAAARFARAEHPLDARRCQDHASRLVS